MSHVWIERQIQESKARIAQLIELWKKENDQKHVAACILDNLARCDVGDSQGRLDAYLFSMFGLITQRTESIFSQTQVRLLTGYITKSLAVQQIDPTHSKLSYLYADYHALLSQIARKSGNSWRASWEQNLACRYLRKSSPSVQNFHTFTLGQMLMRGGMVREAAHHFSEVFQDASDRTYAAKSGLNWLICSRLQRDEESARGIEEKLLVETLADDQQRELEWERACRSIAFSEDASMMRQLLRSANFVDLPVFEVEECLWQMVMQKTELPILKLDLNKSRYRKERNLLSVGPLFEIAAALQAVTDISLTAEIRLERLGDQLQQCDDLKSISSEQLVWHAASKVLTNFHFHAFAEVCRFKLDTLIRLEGSRP